MYNEGQGDPQDHAETVKWYRKAAKHGQASAQVNLGVMYREGQSVSPDYTEALKWFRKAAEQGNADAQSIFGFMYDNGKGVSQNYIRAHMWFNFAVAQGNEMTRKNRDIVAKRMTSAQIAEAQRLVREWKPKKLGEIMRRIVLVVGVCVGVTVVGAEEGLSRE